MTVGEPIATTGMTVRQTEELNARLRQEIERLRGEDAPSLVAAN